MEFQIKLFVKKYNTESDILKTVIDYYVKRSKKSEKEIDLVEYNCSVVIIDVDTKDGHRERVFYKIKEIPGIVIERINK